MHGVYFVLKILLQNVKKLRKATDIMEQPLIGGVPFAISTNHRTALDFPTSFPTTIFHIVMWENQQQSGKTQDIVDSNPELSNNRFTPKSSEPFSIQKQQRMLGCQVQSDVFRHLVLLKRHPGNI